MKSQTVFSLLFCLLNFLLLSGLPAKAQDKYWAVRAGTNYSGIHTDDPRVKINTAWGMRADFLYKEDYTASGFDIGLFYAYRNLEKNGKLQPTSLLGFGGRFRGYTSTRRKLGFHMGYQFNLKLSGDETLQPLLQGPEFGFCAHLNKRLSVEGSFFFPVQKSGEFVYKKSEIVDGVQTETVTEVPYYLYSLSLTLCYNLFDHY